MPTDVAISRDREKGWVLEDDRRIVTFRIKTFQSFVDRLISLVGDHVAETILYQMGDEIGRVAFDYSRKNIKSEDDLRKVLDNVLSNRGWGRCGAIEKYTRDNKIVYIVRVTGTPSSHERASNEPTCHIERGIASGYLEAYLGKKAWSHSELECVSAGGRLCVFEIIFTP